MMEIIQEKLNSHLKQLTGLRNTLNENNVYAYAEIVKGLQAEWAEVVKQLQIPEYNKQAGIDFRLETRKQLTAVQLEPILEAYSTVLTNEEVFTLAKQQDSLDDMLDLLDTIVEDDPREFYYYDPRRVRVTEDYYPYPASDKEIIFLTEAPLYYTLSRLIKLMEDINYV